MFERFTDRARKVAVDAQASARRLGHGIVGTEHILLGLLQGDGIAAQVLTGLGVTPAAVEREVLAEVGRGPLGARDAEALGAIGIDLDEVRRRIEASFGPGALRWHPDPRCRQQRQLPLRGHIPFSPRAKKVLELSLREALALKHNHIGTEHILLGVIREGEGLAMLALTRLGAGPELLRTRVLDALRSTG
ncbi:MAG TPA: Clp protease N-terminal domain-containing protein [Actinomycetota bacterium]|nr:Clp protease N-terminal domain-containing protein [Actinomycetota bacterium]